MSRRLLASALLLGVLGVGVVGVAGPASNRTIEGYPVGDKMCAGEHAVSGDDPYGLCAVMSGTAVGMLKPRARVVSIETYADIYHISRVYGTGHAQGVVVVKLEDGTTRAIFLGCVMGPFGYPPKAGPCGRMEPMEGEQWSLPPAANKR